MTFAVPAPSAGELAAAVRAGRTAPEELVERALARLEEVDGRLGAFVRVDAEWARREARELSRRRPAGPLAGVPVGVKDLFDVAGEATRAGSVVPAGPPAVRDAVAVARVRAAGAVVLGRTRTHEFAWGMTTQSERCGSTRNPWDLTRVPGGSSGGSAAAVAAGIVPLGLGTDTGCSIRLPSAWCGLVGHKPSHGLVPLAGCVPLAPSLDCGGALVRTVADARLVLEVLQNRPLAPPAPVAGLRFGVVPAGPGALRPEVARAVERAAGRAEELGVVREVRLPLADRLVELYALTQGPEALAWHRRTGRWPSSADAYGPDVRAHLERCERQAPEQVARAAVEREDLRRRTAALFEEVDLLLLPVVGGGPPPVDAPTVVDLPAGPAPLRAAVLPWTALGNLCGLPACSVPAGRDDDGLPIGVQVVGPVGADARVLDAADALALGPAAP